MCGKDHFYRKNSFTIHSSRNEFIVSKNDVEGFIGKIFLNKNKLDLQINKINRKFFISKV
jgi:hypothetical protein